MPQVFASAIDQDACSVECLHPDAIAPLLGRTLGPDGARRVADVFSVLADPTRTRIVHLLALSPRELCVCDIALVLGLSVSALSHQLRFLRERGLCERRREGRLMYYRLADARLRTLVMDAVAEVAA
jgi:ArsR family transcriptional regulator